MRPMIAQPISFDPETDLCCAQSCWNQIIAPTDEISVGIQFNPCPDAPEQITGGEFSVNLPGWTVTQGSAFAAGSTLVLFFSSSIQQTLTLTPGALYRLTVAIDFAGNNQPLKVEIGTASFQVPGQQGTYTYYFFGQGNTLNLVNEALDAGNFIRVNSISIIPMEVPTMAVRNITNTNDLSTDVVREIYGDRVVFRFTPDTDTIAAGAFRLLVTQNCTAPNTLLSEVIGITDELNCTLGISVCADVSDWNGANFQPFARLNSKLRADSYEPEVTRYRSSIGRYFTPYGHQRKIFTLSVERSPEHIRDWIAFLAICQTISIQKGTGAQKEYSAYDNADSPQFTKGDDYLASITIPLIEKQSLLMAVNDQDCAITRPPVVLGELATETVIQADTNDSALSGT